MESNNAEHSIKSFYHDKMIMPVLCLKPTRNTFNKYSKLKYGFSENQITM